MVTHTQQLRPLLTRGHEVKLPASQSPHVVMPLAAGDNDVHLEAMTRTALRALAAE
jgi:hypothetical protein